MKLIISEEEKLNILGLHNKKVLSEQFDASKGTYVSRFGQTLQGILNDNKNQKINVPAGTKFWHDWNAGKDNKVYFRANNLMYYYDCAFTGYKNVFTDEKKLGNWTNDPLSKVIRSYFCNGNRIKTWKEVTGGKTEGNNQITPPTVDQVADCKNKLSFSQGMRGDSIKEVQGLLGSKYSALLGTKQYDGVFGPATKKAVMQFQKDNTLSPTGVVDCNTLIKMRSVLSASITPNTPAPKPANPDLALGDQSGAVNLTPGGQTGLPLQEKKMERIIKRIIKEEVDQPDYIKVYHMYKDGEVSKKDFYSYMGILEKHERQALIDYIESQKRGEQMESSPVNEDMTENTLHRDIMRAISNSNSSHKEAVNILRSIADEMESSRKVRRDVENRFRGDMNEESDYEDDPQIRLFVPEEMEGAIMELGERPTPGTIIRVFNDMFQGDVSELVNFDENLFLFIDEDGEKLTPEDIYEMINDATQDDGMYDDF